LGFRGEFADPPGVTIASGAELVPQEPQRLSRHPQLPGREVEHADPAVPLWLVHGRKYRFVAILQGFRLLDPVGYRSQALDLSEPGSNPASSAPASSICRNSSSNETCASRSTLRGMTRPTRWTNR